MSQAKEGNATSETGIFSSSEQLERNDQQHVAEWHEPATLTLDELGMIHDCSKSGESLFGYRRSDLMLQHVSWLFPQLSDVVLVENSRINPRLSFLCHCGHHFMAHGREGRTFLSKLSFVLLDIAEKGVLKLIVWPDGNAEPI
ncbi:MAG: PAS domain-containing protein [Gallionellaceae bacterium]